jgi:hypothetical protein
MATSGCSGSPSISVLPSSDEFTQNGNEITAKMDILWVIDNSGSMIEEQKNLRDNFSSFITEFVGKGYDFRIAVTTTDAWLTNVYTPPPTVAAAEEQPGGYTQYADFNATGPISAACDNWNGSGPNPDEFYQDSPLLSSTFLNGNVSYGEQSGGVITATGSPSGYSIISSDDAGIDFSLSNTGAANDVEVIFGKNILQGVCGSGQESGIRSMLTALENPANAGFPRADAHLAVILVSDEEDFLVESDDTLVGDMTYPEFSITNVDAAIKDKLAGDSTYSFHNISILDGDSSCLSFSGGSSSYGTMYEELAAVSKGKTISICSDFSVGLSDIAQSIIETTVEFKLTDVPKSTDGAGFVVSVKNVGDADFVTIPKDPNNGWTYNAERNSIIFHGTGIPAQNAQLNIFYDPTGL